MESIMRAIAFAGAAAAVLTTAGCLGPRVKDKPGASAHLLPAGATVPYASDSPELKNQITLNDGIDDKALAMNGDVILRADGLSNGMPVKYWSFGASTRAPSPIYKFFARTDTGALTPIVHPPLVDALPGDPGYSGVHSIVNVVVTADYHGELITTSEALADAIELGLIEVPAPAGKFVASPIVLLTAPDTVGPSLQVGENPAGHVVAHPEEIYGRGYRAGAFELGGAAGIQPGAFILPASEVSFLRPPDGPVYDPSRPIFQATIPAAPPADGAKVASYTPLSIVIDVDLKTPADFDNVKSDTDLFVRTAGAISGVKTDKVAQFQVTPSILLLPLQFQDGVP
jgi:hypothetical protein